MEDKKNKIHQILIKTTHLPKQLIKNYGRNNSSEFILHSLSNQDCFNLQKAAYFIDNPDFNNLQGIAGFHLEDSYKDNHWDFPDLFSSHMEQMAFNKSVKNIIMPSINKNQKEQKEVVKELGFSLGIQDPHFISWPVKYDNYGLLIFELLDLEDIDSVREQLELGVHLLGFCSIF